MNRKENKKERLLIDQNTSLSIFNHYQGKRVQKNNRLNRKNLLLGIKLALISSLVLGVNTRSESKTLSRQPLPINSSRFSSFAELVEPRIYEPIFTNMEQIKDELTPRTNIFIGDSRTKGMILSGAIEESESIYGVGYGLAWFLGNGEFNENKTNALDGAITKLRNMLHEDERYNIIIWLGVNDLKRNTASRYFEEFVNLATELQNQKFYIVSVGPVRNNAKATCNNSQIDSFNEELKELIRNSDISNIEYIDLSDYDFKVQKYDNAGIHYGYQDYRNIHNIIETALEESKTLKLKNH